MNKYLSLAALLVATLGLVSDLHSQTKPRAEQKGSWKTLDHKGFGAWKIASFEMKGNAADGGSTAYSFVTDKGLEFDVMVANDSYWTDDEIAKKMQVFYLVHGDRFYKVHQGSDREKLLLRMLTSAKSRLKGEGHEDPKLLDILLLHLRTRMPWPEDEEDPKESGQAEEAF